MTVKNVKEKLEEIRNCIADPEEAHSKEDDLLHAVIEAIAAGKTDDPRGLALEALQSRNINFPRWYA